MAATFSGASLRGDKRFVRAIAKLRDPELKKLNTRALKRAGERVRNRARRSYLSGSPLRKITGDLFASVIASSPRPADFMTIGSPLPQAMPLHFGWPAHNMRPRPWLFPALEDEIPTLADVWISEMDKAVGAAR